MIYETGAALDGVRLVNAILEFPFRKHAATFCSLASGAGTLFAGKCLHKMSTNVSAEKSLTSAAIGMAVSSLSLVGSVAWFLYERRRHRAFMERRKSSFDKKSEATVEEDVDRLNKAIPSVDTTLQDEPEDVSNSDEVRRRVQPKTTPKKSNEDCENDDS